MFKLIKCAMIALIAFVFFYASGVSYAVYTFPSDRTITWQGNIGVNGGIPNRTTICATLSPSGGNDATAIQTAINNCPQNQVVKLNTGTFNMSGQIVVKSNVTIRGDGMGVTVIKGNSSFNSAYGSGLISFKSSGTSYDLSANPAINLASGYAKGSTAIIALTAHNWNVGDVIVLDQLNSNTSNPPVTTTDSEGCGIACGRSNGTRSLGQMNRVVSVISPTQVNLEIPLYYNYNSSLSPQAVKVSGLTVNSGIEDLTVDNSVSFADTAFSLDAASDSWVLRTEVKTGTRQLFSIAQAYRNTIKSSKFVGATTWTQATPGGGYGLVFLPWASANLIEDNIILDTPIMMDGVTSGNVFAYNYITAQPIPYGDDTRQHGFIFIHGANPSMNLFEGNIWTGSLAADFYHGSSNFNTFFRNQGQLNTAGTGQNWLINLFKKAQYYNIVGNILGTSGYENIYEATGVGVEYNTTKIIYRLGYQDGSGSWQTTATPIPYGPADTQVKNTLLRHGNWDSATNGVVWNGADDRSLPASLYLTSKPSWWGSLIWPSIGPDISGYVASIPAKDRFLGGTPPPTTYQCSDNLDNDFDSLTDYPDDPGCSSSTDNDEYNAPVQNFPTEQIIEAESGQITSMQTGTSGLDTYIYTSTNDIGSAKYTFDIPTTGQYKLEAKTNSNNDGGQNSFFVGLDNEAAQGNTLYIYNIFPLSTGFVWDEVAKWGNGQTGNPPISEFDPMAWNLTQGTHSFTFYGRESNTWLDQIILKIIDTSPVRKGDFNSDGKVNADDLSIFKSAFNLTGQRPEDLNSDSIVSAKDFGILMSSWLP